MLTIYRLPWGDFPDVVVHTNVGKLEAHPDYARAKSGDPDAGIRLAADLLKVEKVSFPIVDAVVPVVQPDAGRKNAIPIAMAAILAQRLGLEPVGTITQTNDVAHTAANAASRILAQPTFSGKIRPFARVLIVDDVVTFGSTIANLRGWIHQQRAVVVGCSCLAAAFGSSKLKPPQSIRDQLDQRHYHAHRDLAETIGFFGECWTNREARFLLQQPPETMQQLIQAAQAVYRIGYDIPRTEKEQLRMPSLVQEPPRVQKPQKEPPAQER
jgi:hypothetical protein